MGARIDPAILAALLEQLQGTGGQGLALNTRGAALPSIDIPLTRQTQQNFRPSDRITSVTGEIARDTSSIPYLNIATGIVDAGAQIGKAIGGGKSEKRAERSRQFAEAGNAGVQATREVSGFLRDQAQALTGPSGRGGAGNNAGSGGLSGASLSGTGVAELVQAILSRQGGAGSTTLDEILGKQAGGPQSGRITSPIVPTNPDDGSPRDPSKPTPGEGGNDGKQGGRGKAIASGISSGAAGIGQLLLGAFDKESTSQRDLNFARAGAANASAAGTNSRALQALMQILLRGGTGRGG